MAFRIRKPSQESFFALNAIPLYSYAIPLGGPQGASTGKNYFEGERGFVLSATSRAGPVSDRPLSQVLGAGGEGKRMRERSAEKTAAASHVFPIEVSGKRR